MSDSFVNPIFGDREEPATGLDAEVRAPVEDRVEARVQDQVENPVEVSAEVQPEVQPDVEGTGHPEVEAVVSSLDDLDDLPVADHVAVFEQAHESLRRTLVGAGQDGRVDSWAADRD
jgi:hypothetical protein